MKTLKYMVTVCLLIATSMLYACSQVPAPLPEAAPPETTPAEQLKSKPGDLQPAKSTQEKTLGDYNGEDNRLPVRFQNPSYLLKEQKSMEGMGQKDEKFTVQVGADVTSTTGPIPLKDILKRLAALKNMNVSWSSDVDQYVLVDVDIRAEDDFYQAIDNLLRQQDYYHMVQGNTIVVNYKETRKFHIALPFMASNYKTGIGGDVLGSSGSTSNMTGNLQLLSADNKFDIWENIRQNLNQVLDIWTAPTPQTPAADPAVPAAPAKSATAPVAAPTTSPHQSGKGYYTIDKPIGLITVTAPRPLIEKIESYLANLKKELYRQVAIEAKIIEVVLDDSSKSGVDWQSLLDNSSFGFDMNFGKINATTPFGDNRSLTLTAKSFDLAISALETQGRTKILANPKISVMNGQPAMISVGTNSRYIDKVTQTVDATTGTITYAITTSSVMSGLGLGVVATILDNDEIILSLTPVTSQVELENGKIPYETIGGGNKVGLPVINLREMNTLVRIKNGELLVVGGLIDTSNGTKESKVPFLGDLPFIKKLFRYDTKTEIRKELIILLRPIILSSILEKTNS